MVLPSCHSRRELPGEARVFFCAHPRFHAPGQRVRAEICQVCSLWREPPPASFRPVRPSAALTPCVHLGDECGRRACTSCRGQVQVKVFRCHHPRHEVTTIAECDACPDYHAAAEAGPAAPAVAARA